MDVNNNDAALGLKQFSYIDGERSERRTNVRELTGCCYGLTGGLKGRGGEKEGRTDKPNTI